MSYTTAALQTVADCDASLSLANKDKADLEYRKIQLERQKTFYAATAGTVESELAAVNAEVDAYTDILAALPAGEAKDQNTVKLKRLELKQFLLNERKTSYGVVALLDKELEIAKVQKQLDELVVFIAAINTRKAAI